MMRSLLTVCFHIGLGVQVSPDATPPHPHSFSLPLFHSVSLLGSLSALVCPAHWYSSASCLLSRLNLPRGLPRRASQTKHLMKGEHTYAQNTLNKSCCDNDRMYSLYMYFKLIYKEMLVNTYVSFRVRQVTPDCLLYVCLLCMCNYCTIAS